MPLPGTQPLPAGVALRPLTASGAPPLIAVAINDAGPRGLILLRETADALVYAGALMDAGQRILQWLEIWVQRVAASPFFSLGKSNASNAARDERWHELRRAFAEADADRVILAGREDAPAAPCWWTPDGQPVRFDGEVSVANQDQTLIAAGLPGYAATEHRYLAIRHEAAGQTEWLPLTPGAPASSQSPARQPGNAALVFNPHGGHVFFRFAASFPAAEFANALASGQLPPAGPRLINSALTPAAQDIRHQPGYFLRSWHGETPPLAEIFHLKLSLIHGFLTAVESAVRSRRMPLLNLKTRSFGVDWAGERSGLALWTVQPVLDQPSAATRWLGGDGDDPVFLLAEEPPSSIYRHPEITAPRFVRANVRLSQLKPVGSQKDQLETEGTLILQESLPRLTDILLIHCPLASRPIQAAVTSLEPSRGEIVFRTARWQPVPDVAQSLSSGGQAPPPMDCDCALVPRLSSPADLYSLGVIALEILCAGSGAGLPMILDEALRIAQRLGTEKSSLDAIPDTLAAWQRRESDKNWATVLSPRQLCQPSIDADAASRMIPPVAWFSALTWTLRLLTGSFPQAYFQSPGEGSAQSPQSAFDIPLRDLRAILHRSRALVTMEWRANQEIREQILALMER